MANSRQFNFLAISLVFSPSKDSRTVIRPSHSQICTPLQTWTLGNLICHFSAAFCPIGLKFGLWLVLIFILVPYIHSKTARVAASTLNMESTLTSRLLRRPLIKVGQMVSGHFLLTPWVVCNWFCSWDRSCQTHSWNSAQCPACALLKGILPPPI